MEGGRHQSPCSQCTIYLISTKIIIVLVLRLSMVFLWTTAEQTTSTLIIFVDSIGHRPQSCRKSKKTVRRSPYHAIAQKAKLHCTSCIPTRLLLQLLLSLSNGASKSWWDGQMSIILHAPHSDWQKFWVDWIVLFPFAQMLELHRRGRQT